MCSKFTMKIVRRKPSKWAVEFDGRTGFVEKTGRTERIRRWKLTLPDGPGGYFASRRGAIHYFVTGEKFETNPVFAVLGGRRGTRRIR